MPDASIQISDSDVLALEQAGTVRAGAMTFYFPLLAPPADGGGVDVKDTGDITGGQHGTVPLNMARPSCSYGICHQALPLTGSGSRECPNQWLKTEPAGASARIFSFTSW